LHTCLKRATAYQLYVNFEHIIEEMGGNHKCIFQEDTDIALMEVFGQGQ
jgi:hypothetical protein